MLNNKNILLDIILNSFSLDEQKDLIETLKNKVAGEK
jgi:hypothetical protein